MKGLDTPVFDAMIVDELYSVLGTQRATRVQG